MNEATDEEWERAFTEHRPWAEDLDVFFFRMVHAKALPTGAPGRRDPERASRVYTLACRAATPLMHWLHRRTVDRWNWANDELYRRVFDRRFP